MGRWVTKFRCHSTVEVDPCQGCSKSTPRTETIVEIKDMLLENRQSIEKDLADALAFPNAILMSLYKYKA